MEFQPIDQLWLLMCSGLVLLMQAGFLCLEAGLTRSKNSVNVALKNLVDLAITPLLFLGFGAGLMFGPTWGGLIGTGGFGLQSQGATFTFLIFQTLFCASAATIVSGAVAERMRFPAYVLGCVAISGLIYPLVGHWAWGGVWTGQPGWLEARGFKDFAGSGVVHMTGGFAALAGAMAIGPRIGRFDPERIESGFPKSSLPIAMLGALLLSVGWIGFNGGSTLRFDDSIGMIVSNTVLSGSAGGAVCLAIARWRSPIIAPEEVINGLLSGLVAVCALANVAAPVEAIIVGSVAGAASTLAGALLVRARIDDVVGAFPVHGVGGVIGLLSQPLMSGVPTESGLMSALLTQSIGAVAIAAVAFSPIYALFAWTLPRGWSRVTADEERAGLNRSEHGVESELQTLLTALTVTPTNLETELPASNPDVSDDAGALAAELGQRIDAAFHEGEAVTLVEAKRIQAEELRDHSRFLQAVLDGLESQVGILDAAGQIIETNRVWDEFFNEAGIADQAGCGASFTELCRSERLYDGDTALELSKAVELIAAGIEDARDTTYSVLVGSEERTLQVVLKPLPKGDRGAVIVFQYDRTEQRRSQQAILNEKRKAETLAGALEASQASLELAMRGGNLGLWHWDVPSGYFELTPEWSRQRSVSENLDADIASFRAQLHADDTVLWTVEDAASLAPDEPYDRQFRLRKSDGTYAWVQVLGRSNSLGPDGAPESLSGVMIDITERKTAALRDAGMATIIEESINEVYVFDRITHAFIEVNRGARENLGYSLEELRQMTPADIHGGESGRSVGEKLLQLETGEQRVEFETLHQRGDGTTYPAMVTVQSATLLDRDVYVAIAVDLTQRRQLESQLADAQRLESIGQLAAGVAHEMNTPLQFVGNNIKFLSDCSDTLFGVIDALEHHFDEKANPISWNERSGLVRKELEDCRFDRVRTEVPKAIDESLEGIDRVLNIVHAMKEFSHPGEQAKAPTDLNRALTSSTTVTRSRWKYAAELTLELDPNLPYVNCEGVAINQVFVNLIVNAADAIAERAERDANAPGGRIIVRSWLDGDNVVFEFEDNGCGMPPEVVRRVFEPFYTTKEVGKGTGQGLSLSHTIVTQKHGGLLTIRSEAGRGTNVTVTLPRGSTDGVSSVEPCLNTSPQA